MTVWDRIRTVDRRFIYIVFAVILLLPQFVPVVLPLKVDRMTVPLHEYIEANIRPGDPVWISVEYSGVMKSEMTPTLETVALHLFEKGARMFLSGNSADGAMFAQQLWDLAPPNYEWGVNFVNFGFIAGYEAAVAALVESIPRTVPADFFGAPTADMEIMRGIEKITDIKFVYQLTGGGLGPLLWVRQVGDPYGIPIASCVSSSMLASAVPYYETGQLMALLNGLVGAAEYEYLTGIPGAGTAGMAGQSLGHLFFIGLVLLGNLAFIMQRREKQ